MELVEGRRDHPQNAPVQNHDEVTSAVLIGAGPYGLAVGAHLRARRIPVRVFGEPMEAWRRNMPAGMFLKSTPSASSISAPDPGHSLDDYCRAKGIRPLTEAEVVPISLFVDYGLWFQDQLVPVDHDRITHVRSTGGEFEVTVSSGECLRARNVVVATGHLRYATTPPVFASLPADRRSHTRDHDDLSKFAGREVAVIGAGQSALESAALLREAGADVHVLVRERRVLWAGPPEVGRRTLSQKLLKPESPLGPGWSHVASHRGAGAVRLLPAAARLAMVRKILGPSGAWWLHDRVMGPIDVRTSCEVRGASVQDGRVVLDCETPDGRTRLEVDHVLAATGYRVDLEELEFLDESLRSRITRVHGFPVLRPDFASSVPGLYFAGLSSAGTFGPLMRFVCGTDFAAPRVAAGVAARR